MTKSATREAADKVTFTQTEVTSAVALKAPIASPVFTGNVSHGDNVKAKFGTGNDLEIFHDGSHSRIKDVGTGHLVLSGGEVHFNNSDNTSNHLVINSAGIVTKPLQPAFGARSLSNAHSGAGTTGTNHTLVFSSANNNTGNHYSTSTGLFTAPVAGNYFVTFSGLYNATNNNTGPVYLMRNGAEKYRAYHDNSGTNYEQISVSGVLSVSANDTISVYSVIAGWHVGGETSFSGYLIG